MVGESGGPGGGAPPMAFYGADELVQRGGSRQFPLQLGADRVDPRGAGQCPPQERREIGGNGQPGGVEEERRVVRRIRPRVVGTRWGPVPLCKVVRDQVVDRAVIGEDAFTRYTGVWI